MIARTDCRHFRGDRPCRHERLCEGCGDYDPMGTRILLIKLAAAGDVLRTTPLLPALRRRYDPCHITWVVRPESRELLEGLPGIDRLLPLALDAAISLPAEEFDLLLCLDKEPAATGLAVRLPAKEKKGFLMDRRGSLVPAGPEAEYAYRLGLDNDLKYSLNEKTYQQIIFEVCGLRFGGEDYQLHIGEADRLFAREVYDRLGVPGDERLIGFNVGAGENFAYKGWRADGFAELAGIIESELGARVVLLGGERERERIEMVKATTKAHVLDPGATPSVRQFAALVERCCVVVTGDTLAMHLALAIGRAVVVIFGSTCAQEIELYGRGEKIVPHVDCHPCYKKRCDFTETCVASVSAAEVLEACRRLWEEAI